MTTRGATLIHDLDLGLLNGSEPHADRLAELVAHLSDCPAPTADAAVRAASAPDRGNDDEARLLVVARALVAIRRQRRSH